MNTEFDPSQVGPMCWGACESFLPINPSPGSHPFLCRLCQEEVGDISPRMQDAASKFKAGGTCPSCGSASPESTSAHCRTCRVIQYVAAKAAAARTPNRMTPEEIAARAKAGRMTPEEIAARSEARELGRIRARQQARMVRECAVCGGEFNPIGAQKCCSPECKAAYAPKARIVLTCPVCGKEFNPIGAQKCCSQRCKDAHHRGQCGVCGNYDVGRRNCVTCGKEFDPDFVKQVHCSPTCAVAGFNLPDGDWVAGAGEPAAKSVVSKPDTFRTEVLDGPDLDCDDCRVLVTRGSDGESLEKDIPFPPKGTLIGDIVQTVGLELSEKLGYRAGIDILE